MKKRVYTFALFSLLSFGSTFVYGQAGVKPADKSYDRWAYVDAQKLYEKVLKRGHESQELLEKVGNTYYFNGRYAEAYPYYEQLFSNYVSAGLADEYYYRYAQTLQHVGNQSEAKRYYNMFAQKVGNQSQIAQIRQNESDLQAQIEANSGRYNALVNLPINTPWADYGSYVHDNQLYFTSARDTGSLAKKVHTWTGDAFTSLYTVDAAANEIKNVKRIKGAVRTSLNESSAVITKDGQTMYFTRNNHFEGKRGYDEDRNTRLKIYRAHLHNGKWSNVEELPINGDDFNTAHPALSADEKTLYFASDRPGGFGGSDLWKVAINGQAFGVPQNLGATINTEARETFPFINSNDELYFSSDGRVGLGGLDVYATKIRKDGSVGEVQNVGAPINSNADDFAYYIDYESKHGFVSSNREGGQGNDDIYSFIEHRALQLDCIQALRLMVVDSKTRNIIPDATVTLYDAMYNEQGKSSRYVNNNYHLMDNYECGSTYRIKVEKTDYITQEVSVIFPNESGLTERTVVLERKQIEVKPGDDLFKKLELNPIYFDLDKHNIRPDAALELAKIVAVMEEYPLMKIDVRSHTDSRASMKYNDQLSERRAKATAEWLISQGIDRSRLTWKGYGERDLYNDCKDGVPCTEEQHQENRRSEFIIKEM